MKYLVAALLLWPWLRLLRLLGSVANGRKLVIQTAKIGDWINSTPLIRALAPVDVVCAPVSLPLARHDAHVRIAWVMDAKSGLARKSALALRLFREGYADIYVLTPNAPNLYIARLACARTTHALETYRTSRTAALLGAGFRRQPHGRDDLTIDSYLRLAGLPASEEARRKHATFPLYRPEKPCFAPGPGFRVGISLAAGNRLKTLPMALWQKLFAVLARYQPTVHVFGLEDERPLLNELRSVVSGSGVVWNDCLGRIPLEALPWHIGQMHLYISSDTGNSYIADSLEVPLVNFAGPCHMREQRPLGARSLVVETPGIEPFSFIFSAPYKSDLTADKLYAIGDQELERVARFIEQCYRRSRAAEALRTPR